MEYDCNDSFSFWLWTKWTSIWLVIKRKSGPTIIFISMWKETERDSPDVIDLNRAGTAPVFVKYRMPASLLSVETPRGKVEKDLNPTALPARMVQQFFCFGLTENFCWEYLALRGIFVENIWPYGEFLFRNSLNSWGNFTILLKHLEQFN